MVKVFVVSDNHFNQGMMIHFGRRPFKSVVQMNNEMIVRWNETVTDQDIVVVVGDFALGSKEKIERVVEQLKGRKYLIEGNHDTAKRRLWLEGVIEGYKDRIELEIANKRLLFTHKPQKEGQFHLNLHGHHHRKLRGKALDSSRYYNVAVEFNEYTPQLLGEVMQKKGMVLGVSYDEVMDKLVEQFKR